MRAPGLLAVDRCPLCGGNDGREARRTAIRFPEGVGLTPYEMVIKECGCGGAYADPALDDASLAKITLYDSSVFRGEDRRTREATARRHIDLLERLHPTPGSLLDIGCSVGAHMVVARERGWSPVGVDASEQAVSRARDEGGLTAYHAPFGLGAGIALPTELAGKRFDAVLVMYMLTFIRPVAPMLDLIDRSVAPGGLLMVGLPDYGSWLGRRLGARWRGLMPNTPTFFSADRMAKELEGRGFRVTHVDRSPVRIHSFGYAVAKAFKPWGIGAEQVPFGRRLISLPAFDCFEMAAIKQG